MSLLLQALQKAARNREGPGAEPSADLSQGLELTPQDNPRIVDDKPSPRYDLDEIDLAPPPKRPAAPAGGAMYAETDFSNPTLLDYARERPVVLVGILALAFAVFYGIYLWLQIFHPQWLRGDLSRSPVISATTPPPASTSPLPSPSAQYTPPPASTYQPNPPLPGLPSSPAGNASSNPSVSAAPATGSGAALPATGSSGAASSMGSNAAAGGAQQNTELASLMNLPSKTPPPRTAPEQPSRLTSLGKALNTEEPMPPAQVRPAPPPTQRSPDAIPAPARPAPAAAARPLPPPAPRAAASGPKPMSQTQPGSNVIELKDQVVVNAAPSVAVPSGPTVADAYRAWKSGKLDQAKSMYQDVLANEPKNIDALLGLAGVAQQQGNSQEALTYYGRVLESDPRNSSAQAGIIAMTGQSDPSASEARLKLLISREPSGFLHFSLGNLYARQNQWAQAQQSYFQAYQMDADNADYAYNLAVGLEHIGQPKLAITYYRKAIDLSLKQGRATFNQEQVIDRITKLSLRGG